MTYQQIPGDGFYLPQWPDWTGSGSHSAGLLIDATGEKAAMTGYVFRKDRAGGDITKVHFMFGAVTKAGGSGLTLSLQNVLLTTFGGVPDETQDQTEAIANGDANFASNTWHPGAALSANRTVTFGELLSVVWEYDGGGRLGSDSVIINAISADAVGQQPGCRLKTGGTWANAFSMPSVVLEFTDGVFGTLRSSAGPVKAFGSLTYGNTSNPDENALEFSVPWKCKVDGGWVMLFLNGDADFDIVLYDGTTAMTNGTVSIDEDTFGVSGGVRRFYFSFGAEIELAANTVYRLSIKPTTANSVNLRYIDVHAADHLQAWAGGTAWRLNSRVDAGAWQGATTTRRPMIGLSFSSFDDGAGAATGIVTWAAA